MYYKISQYADDTTLLLDGTKFTLKKSLECFDQFSKLSGLKINNTKTETMWIGSLNRKSDIPFPET